MGTRCNQSNLRKKATRISQEISDVLDAAYVEQKEPKVLNYFLMPLLADLHRMLQETVEATLDPSK